jgi:hypothetical protein
MFPNQAATQFETPSLVCGFKDLTKTRRILYSKVAGVQITCGEEGVVTRVNSSWSIPTDPAKERDLIIEKRSKFWVVLDNNPALDVPPHVLINRLICLLGDVTTRHCATLKRFNACDPNSAQGRAYQKMLQADAFVAKILFGTCLDSANNCLRIDYEEGCPCESAPILFQLIGFYLNALLESNIHQLRKAMASKKLRHVMSSNNCLSILQNPEEVLCFNDKGLTSFLLRQIWAGDNQQQPEFFRQVVLGQVFSTDNIFRRSSTGPSGFCLRTLAIREPHNMYQAVLQQFDIAASTNPTVLELFSHFFCQEKLGSEHVVPTASISWLSWTVSKLANYGNLNLPGAEKAGAEDRMYNYFHGEVLKVGKGTPAFSSGGACLLKSEKLACFWEDHATRVCGRSPSGALAVLDGDGSTSLHSFLWQLFQKAKLVQKCQYGKMARIIGCLIDGGLLC